MAVKPGDGPGQHRAGAAIGVVDLHFDFDWRAAVDRRLRLRNQFTVEHVFQMMVLSFGMENLLTGGFVLLEEQF